MELNALYASYIESTTVNDIAFACYLLKYSWHLDFNSGTVDFGNERRFPVQILGTEAQATGTWLWSWANTASHIHPNLLRAVNTVREFGIANRVPELIEPEISLQKTNGSTLAIVCSGLTKISTLFRGPYDGGAVYFLVEGVPISQQKRPNPAVLMGALMRGLSKEVNHYNVVLSLLKTVGFEVWSSPTLVKGLIDGNEAIIIEFENGRLRKMYCPPKKQTEIKGL